MKTHALEQLEQDIVPEDILSKLDSYKADRDAILAKLRKGEADPVELPFKMRLELLKKHGLLGALAPRSQKRG